MRAHQIMTKPVATVAPDATIVDAANIMLDRHISGLPVVDASGKLVGIVSEGDFIRRREIGTGRRHGRWLKFLLGRSESAWDFVHENGRRIAEVMTPSPITVTEGTTLAEIADLMERRQIKRLPVLRGDKIVGMISRANVADFLVRQIDDRALIGTTPLLIS